MTRAKRGAVAAVAAACLAILGVVGARAHAPGAKSASLFVPDRGSFRILVNGQQMGKEEFEINPSGDTWVAHGSSEIQTADGVMHVSGTLRLEADGSPVRYEWNTQGKKKASATIDFRNLTATMDLHVEGAKTYAQTFTFSTSPITILDNNLYHQYAVLARLYDRQKKGAQTFAVLVPQALAPGTITVDSLGDQNVGGKKLEELTVKTEDLEVDLFLDGSRLVRIAASSTGAEIVRE